MYAVDIILIKRLQLNGLVHVAEEVGVMVVVLVMLSWQRIGRVSRAKAENPNFAWGSLCAKRLLFRVNHAQFVVLCYLCMYLPTHLIPNELVNFVRILLWGGDASQKEDRVLSIRYHSATVHRYLSLAEVWCRSLSPMQKTRAHRSRRCSRSYFGFQRQLQRHMNCQGVGYQKI